MTHPSFFSACQECLRDVRQVKKTSWSFPSYVSIFSVSYCWLTPFIGSKYWSRVRIIETR